MIPLKLDVVIIGGGIQGLSLLHYARKYGLNHVALFTKGRIGDGETLQGHEWCNNGYLGNDATQMKLAQLQNQELVQFLDEELGGENPISSSSPTYFVAQNDTVCQSEEMSPLSESKLTDTWTKLGLSGYRPIDGTQQPLFRGGTQMKLFQTDDYMINTHSIVNKLANLHTNYVKRGELKSIIMNEKGTSVDMVAIQVPDSEQVIYIRCKHLLLAAGAWTTRLLYSSIEFGREDLRLAFLSTIHKQLKCGKVPMICVTGKSLPEISLIGYALKNKVFWASGICSETGNSIWRVSPVPFDLVEVDETSDVFNPDQDPNIESSAVQHVFKAFKEVIPGIESISHDLQFGVYFGWKTENPHSQKVPKEPYITNFGISNMKVAIPNVWPNVLSVAKTIVDPIVESTASTDTSHISSTILSTIPNATLGNLKSSKIEWTNWECFLSRYDIVYSAL